MSCSATGANPTRASWKSPRRFGDGWYSTGDLARFDEDGFLQLLGRVKRFAKVAGEMVSLEVVERIAETRLATSVHAAIIRPDAGRGEMIVICTQDAKLKRDQLQQAARGSALPISPFRAASPTWTKSHCSEPGKRLSPDHPARGGANCQRISLRFHTPAAATRAGTCTTSPTQRSPPPSSLSFGPLPDRPRQERAGAGGHIYHSALKWIRALLELSDLHLRPVSSHLPAHARRRRRLSPNKKRLLGVLSYLGAGATIAMFALQDGLYLLGGALFLIANLAFGAAVVVYNSFLNDVAPEDERDSVSSQGWGIGYLGGGILLGLNLLLYQNAGKLGLSDALAVRISLGSAGAWWAFFAVIPMFGLRNRPPQRTAAAGENVIAKGFTQIFHTLRGMGHYPQTLTFSDRLPHLQRRHSGRHHPRRSIRIGLPQDPHGSLTLAILMVQFVAFGGAILFNYLAKWMTAYRAVILSLAIWTMLMGGVFLVKTTALLRRSGLRSHRHGRQPGAQPLALFRHDPQGQGGRILLLYEISDKGTSWLAPLLFGLMLQFTAAINSRHPLADRLLCHGTGRSLSCRCEARYP